MMIKNLFLLLVILSAGSLSADEFTYLSDTAGTSTVEVWKISFTGQGFTLFAGGPGKQVEMDAVSGNDGQGIKMSYKVPAENKHINAERQGNYLLLSGVDEKGKPFSKKVQLKRPWFTSYYVLPHFISSGLSQVDFCILEPLNFSVMQLRAIKEKEENLVIGGKTVETVKVCITLPSLARAFWRSYIWYRKSDGIFVKTEETRGFPGTPRTYVIMENP